MENQLIFDFEQFTYIIQPMIEKYSIEKNEHLTKVIKECYERIKKINITVEPNIEELIKKLIEKITNKKLDDEESRLVHDVSNQISIQINRMKKQIHGLQMSNEQMEKQIHDLQMSNEHLKTRMDLAECYNYSFDLICLFIFYYIKPLLKTIDVYKQNYNTWNLVKEEISSLKRKVENGQINSNDLQKFIEPLQKELHKINVDVLVLHEVVRSRHFQVHQHIRSVAEQQDFIDTLETYEFSLNFLHRDFVKHLLNLVKSQKLKRYVN